MKRAIWWIKRDFRFGDNIAFSQALLEADEVLPVFIFEPEMIAQSNTSPMHVWAWRQALKDLKKQARITRRINDRKRSLPNNFTAESI